MTPLPTIEAIHEELKGFVHTRYKISMEVLDGDPNFEEFGADSLTRVEILLHCDDTFGSFVLEYLEDGLLQGDPPSRLSDLARLIPLCLVKPSGHVASAMDQLDDQLRQAQLAKKAPKA
ncbi:hypothetical protein AEP_01703 [Curvibacter sp. AEP1-3]|uniref:hypothetical protein n=1 Tax=Curvibacter sp. AEP1-3 TaxID=1844971 RepID=UPI000B3C4DBF|nr:hypothetical protein [Curvibacter sp. AEP1-3]ARV18647.1 hypothetical protein AEP_01703 [Curvibacter sp. AEP1-3]